MLTVDFNAFNIYKIMFARVTRWDAPSFEEYIPDLHSFGSLFYVSLLSFITGVPANFNLWEEHGEAN